MTSTIKKNPVSFVLAGLLLCVLLFQCLWFSLSTNQTVDETFYNGSAIPTVRFQDYRFLGEHPPLMMHLGGIFLEVFVRPNFDADKVVYVDESKKERDLSKIGAAFLYDMGNNPDQILFWQRLPVILLTLLCGLVLFIWARDLYGSGGALISLILYVFSPNLIAHGSLFTTDMGITGFYFLAAFCLYRMFESPSLGRLCLAGIVAGLALLAKISALVWLPTTLLIFFVYLFRNDSWDKLATARFETSLFYLALALLILSISNKVLAVALSPLCLMSLTLALPPEKLKRFKYFNHLKVILLITCWILCFVFSAKLFKKYESGMAIVGTLWVFGCLCVSWFHFFKPYASHFSTVVKAFLFLWLLAAVTIALGYFDFPARLIRFGPFDHFLRSFNIASTHARSLHTACVGTFVTCDSSYFLKIILVKSSLFFIGFFTTGLIALIFMPIKKATKFLLITVPLVFFLVASFVNQINIGVRHILPVYPFMILIAGASVYWANLFTRRIFKTLIWVLISLGLLFYVSATIRQAPHYLSYFSEWIGGESEGVNFTSDSNIDWGQDNDELIKFLKENSIDSILINANTSNTDLYRYHQIKFAGFDSYTQKPPAGYYVFSLETMRNERMRPEGSWFAENPWTHNIGRTLFLYEVKD